MELAGPLVLTQTTGADGLARFADLPVGVYAVAATMQGLPNSTNNRVAVLSGESTRMIVRMRAAGTTESAEAASRRRRPTFDGQTAITTHLTTDDLQETPNARDPWALLQTVPTVYVDRVNIGGSESGQQSRYNAKGAQATDNTWNLDGVPVTDAGDTSSCANRKSPPVRRRSITTSTASRRWPSPPAAPTFNVRPAAFRSTWC